jgi:hypothetical protein
LAFAAKKCRPIKSFFVTKIPTTSDPAPRSAKTQTATTASNAFAAANESNKYTNISAHGESIEEANVNPTNPTNPSTNQNTNQYTNISANSQKLQDKENRATPQERRLRKKYFTKFLSLRLCQVCL